MGSFTSLAVLAQAAAGEVGSGRIQGGWGYVWASYGIAWGAIALYSLSLWLRRPKASPGMKE
ncbi:MAG TPA: hypothetical protein VF815_00075 [Myxococcaceae bacterium]|jgi:hypothetical protein